LRVLNNEELLCIEGGTVSASMIGYIVRGINSILDLGRSLGSAMRRVQNNSLCPY